MKADRSSLRGRMLLMMALSMLPMLIGITVLFAETIASEERAAEDLLHYTAMEINEKLEKYVTGVYSVSDSFSNDERMLSVIDKDYAENLLEKQRVTTFILNALFESYNRLQPQEKMAAVYVSSWKELFDFIDPNQDPDFVVEQIERLDMNNKERLGRFYWYPLEENFLTTSSYGEVRRDHVVLGSRRVYSALKSGYPYLHIFAVEEKTLHALYRLQAEKLGAQVYIIDGNGGLISSTNEAAVAACALPQAVAEAVAGLQGSGGSIHCEGVQYNTAQVHSGVCGWTTLMLVPADAGTAATQTLYYKILGIVIVCVAFCVALLLLLLYRQFMQPLSLLEAAMRRADTGDLKAYVKPQGQAEMVRMMETYNYMLDGIRNGVDERMRMERMKQDLEMQVLMSQINPHFLYNTLESIVWKAGAAGRSDIGKLAASLGKLYRLSISGGLFVTLQQELDHVQMYMNIQQSRYGSKVIYDVRLHGVDPAARQTLKLILQPVVENCLLYGMGGLAHPLHIRVEARRRGEVLVLAVLDNGIGMDEETLDKLRAQIEHGRPKGEEKNRRSTGIGLHNVCARLRLYAGSGSGLTVWSLPGIGTKVALTLPWHETLPPNGSEKAGRVQSSE